MERFWSKVDASGDCWEWTGARSSGGYGNFWANRKYIVAHRMAYQLTVGPVPEGLDLDHLCRNRGCVNPDHLEPVTRKENLARRAPRPVLTVCRKGLHDMTPDNLIKGAKRGCRACSNARQRERYKAQPKRVRTDYWRERYRAKHGSPD